ncbi:hypothetical protein E4T56_gene14295, partial [Termitomyces sp. T112]
MDLGRETDKFLSASWPMAPLMMRKESMLAACAAFALLAACSRRSEEVAPEAPSPKGDLVELTEAQRAGHVMVGRGALHQGGGGVVVLIGVHGKPLHPRGHRRAAIAQILDQPGKALA